MDTCLGNVVSKLPIFVEKEKKKYLEINTDNTNKIYSLVVELN